MIALAAANRYTAGMDTVMKVLFIGNSHTYKNDMPKRFADLCAARGVSVSVTMLAAPGIGLAEHAAAPQTRFNILYGGYDVVILQHAAHPMGDLDNMRAAARTLVDLIRQAGAVPCLFMTWTQQGDAAGQPAMAQVYESLSKELDTLLAPVGLRWWDEIAKHPETPLYAPDGQHASPAGSMLAARTIADTLAQAGLLPPEQGAAI